MDLRPSTFWVWGWRPDKWSTEEDSFDVDTKYVYIHWITLNEPILNLSTIYLNRITSALYGCSCELQWFCIVDVAFWCFSRNLCHGWIGGPLKNQTSRRWVYVLDLLSTQVSLIVLHFSTFLTKISHGWHRIPWLVCFIVVPEFCLSDSLHLQMGARQ